MASGKIKTTYNIIHSTKGGCGKTSFSLMLASALYSYYASNSNENNECDDIIPAPACVLDMDFQGSSLEYLLLGKNNKHKEKYKYFTDVLSKYTNNVNGYIYNFEHPIKPIVVANSKKIKFDVSFAKLDSQKTFFDVEYNTRFTSNIIKNNWVRFLSDDAINKADDKTYNNVILDMPPNTDLLSNAILDGLLDRRYNKNPKHNVNYFLMQSLDKCHVNATADWFKTFIENGDYVLPKNIFVCFSVSCGEFEQEELENIFTESVKMYKGFLNGLSQNVKNTVKFVLLNYNSDYHKASLQQDGIRNALSLGESVFRFPCSKIAFLKDDGSYPITGGNATQKLIEFMN